VSVAQAGRDLGVHENVLRKWVKEFGSDDVHAMSVIRRLICCKAMFERGSRASNLLVCLFGEHYPIEIGRHTATKNSTLTACPSLNCVFYQLGFQDGLADKTK
jgi:hypothetical protein